MTEIHPKFQKSFEVLALFIHKKSPKGRRHDVNQMYSAAALGSTMLSFDTKGMVYLNQTPYPNFRGVSKTLEGLIPGEPVAITLGHSDGSIWELYIQSTIEEVFRLKTPIIEEPVSEDSTIQPAA